ncbi:MAG: hypothetical protein IPM58_02810 [Nitrospira sp.]|nr:hypothetical protein [Nitrospira sp.]
MKDSTQYPVLRNLQFSPIKQGEDQLVVLWDPSRLSKEKLVLPLNFSSSCNISMETIPSRTSVHCI